MRVMLALCVLTISAPAAAQLEPADWVYAVGVSGARCGEAQGTYNARRQGAMLLSLFLGSTSQSDDTTREWAAGKTAPRNKLTTRVLRLTAPALTDKDYKVVATVRVGAEIAVLVAARRSAAARRKSTNKIVLTHVERRFTPAGGRPRIDRSVSLAEDNRPGLHYLATARGARVDIRQNCGRDASVRGTGRLPSWLARRPTRSRRAGVGTFAAGAEALSGAVMLATGQALHDLVRRERLRFKPLGVVVVTGLVVAKRATTVQLALDAAREE